MHMLATTASRIRALIAIVLFYVNLWLLKSLLPHATSFSSESCHLQSFPSVVPPPPSVLLELMVC